ncbi:hypothetical protein H4R33_006630 [Dimargaris cristalligena]|nr:hypothetical protein H4R33_006630 [Dimargaris cristalligena]
MSNAFDSSSRTHLAAVRVPDDLDLPAPAKVSKTSKLRRIVLWSFLPITIASIIVNIVLACRLHNAASQLKSLATSSKQSKQATPRTSATQRPPLSAYYAGNNPANPKGYPEFINRLSIPRTRLGFDEVFLINLERRPDHLARMRQIADFMHLNMTVFAATDKLTLDRSTFPPGSEGMGDGHLACWDSHRRVIQEVADNPAIETALILEDDADFELDLAAKLTAAFAAIGDRAWDIFFVGHCGPREGNTANAIDASAGVYHSSAPVCLHGYAVSKSGARKLVKELSPPTGPVDLMVMDIFKDGKLDSLAMHPSIISQVHLEGDRSEINGDGGFGITGEDVQISAEERLNMMRLLK